MRLLRLIRPDPFSTALAAELEAEMPDHVVATPPVEKSIAGRYIDGIARMLDIERGNEIRLQAELDAITERLRQTRLVIASLEPAHSAIIEGSIK